MKHVIGVDIGGTNIRAVLYELPYYYVVKKITKKTPHKNTSAFLSILDTCITSLMTDSVQAIGVSCPGPLDFRKGIILKTPHLPLRDFKLIEHIQETFSVPAIMENDANCFTLAQFHAYQDTYDCSTLLGITLGTGLGSGVCLDGSIFHGALCAPELSKIPWNSSVFATTIAEDILSTKGLLRIATQQGLDITTPLELFTLANKGNAQAKTTFELFGKELGRAIACAHALFDPSLIVVGGQISKAWKFFSPAMKQELHSCSYWKPGKVLRNKISEPGCLGATQLTNFL